MEQPFTPLCDAETRHGRKAQGLRSLLQLGLSVPEGIALDVEQITRLLARKTAAVEALAQWLGQRSERLAVRSSAPNEDGVLQSFAGMYATRLDVPPDIKSVLGAVDYVFRSGGSERVASYAGAGSVSIPVVIQEMIQPKISGVAFSRAILPNGEKGAYIEWTHGVGERLVSGRVTPASIAIPWNPPMQRLDRRQMTISLEFPAAQHVESLIGMVEFLGSDAGSGWDIEWAIGQQDDLFLLQIRPVTASMLAPSLLRDGGALPAAPGWAAGSARLVDDGNHAALCDGEVLVSAATEVDFLPAMRRATAIVTEEGGLLSHAAIVARELGKPCVVGLKDAMTLLAPGEPTEVDGARGTVRQGQNVYGGNDVPELDWSAVYLYDRGVELAVEEIPMYVEATLSGLTVHLDDASSTDACQAVDGYVRQQFGAPPRIVESQRRIWAREWRRFGRLQSFRIIEGLFLSAVSAWDRRMLDDAIQVLKASAALLSLRWRGSTALDGLFHREVGAALHALVSVMVEGHAVWNCYRDSAIWRKHNEVAFKDLLTMNADGAPLGCEDMLGVLADLAKLRNESFNYFREVGAFDGEYFGARDELVRSACAELGLAYVGDDVSLTTIYGRGETRARDVRLRDEFMSLMSGTARQARS